MAEILSVTGPLVGFERVPYGEFVDRTTGEKVAEGETRWVWVGAPDGQVAPMRIKCKLPAFETLLSMGLGAPVTISYSLTAKRDLVQRDLVTLAGAASRE